MKAAEANALLKSGDDRAIHQMLRKAPADIDPALAADKLVGWLDEDRSVWGFARYYKKLPVPVIAALMKRLEGRAGPSQAQRGSRAQRVGPDREAGPAEIFLRVYLAGEKDLAAAWERAMYRLLSLDTTYAWGSKQKREKLTGLAQEPKVVEALQAAAVGSAKVRLDALAVLAIDASDASVDALMPHFERAATEKDRGLDRLQDLKKYATPTPAMTAMLARVDALLGERNATSPALALADHIGVGPLTTFWFRCWLGSTELNRFSVPRIQGNFAIDSRSPDWFSVSLSVVEPGGLRSQHSAFSSEKVYGDSMKLGRCGAEEVPAWLARAARKLKCAWTRPEHASSNLRGKKRDRVIEWLIPA